MTHLTRKVNMCALPDYSSFQLIDIFRLRCVYFFCMYSEYITTRAMIWLIRHIGLHVQKHTSLKKRSCSVSPLAWDIICLFFMTSLMLSSTTSWYLVKKLNVIWLSLVGFVISLMPCALLYTFVWIDKKHTSQIDNWKAKKSAGETISDNTESNWYVVSQFLTPAQGRVHYSFSAEYEKTETLMRHNFSSVYVSCVYFHSRSQNHLQWINFTDILGWFLFIINSIIRWASECDNFTFHTNVCNLILLFSLQRYIKWSSYFLKNKRR